MSLGQVAVHPRPPAHSNPSVQYGRKKGKKLRCLLRPMSSPGRRLRPARGEASPSEANGVFSSSHPRPTPHTPLRPWLVPHVYPSCLALLWGAKRGRRRGRSRVVLCGLRGDSMMIPYLFSSMRLLRLMPSQTKGARATAAAAPPPRSPAQPLLPAAPAARKDHPQGCKKGTGGTHPSRCHPSHHSSPHTTDTSQPTHPPTHCHTPQGQDEQREAGQLCPHQF